MSGRNVRSQDATDSTYWDEESDDDDIAARARCAVFSLIPEPGTLLTWGSKSLDM